MSWELITIVVLAIYAGISTFFCLKFAVAILKIEDAVEDGLDAIDKRYASISEISQRPLFYDTPEIRRVLEDIIAARESMLSIAVSLSDNFNQRDNDSQEGS